MTGDHESLVEAAAALAAVDSAERLDAGTIRPGVRIITPGRMIDSEILDTIAAFDMDIDTSATGTRKDDDGGYTTDVVVR
jgi:hypothetical protein